MKQILVIIFFSIVIVAISQFWGMATAQAEESQSKSGEPKLIRAVAENHLDLVKGMLNAGIDANLKDKAGNTALLYAVSMGSVEMVNELVQHGANLDLQFGKKKENILFECARNDSVSIAKILLKKNSSLLNNLNSDGETPLFEAARAGAPKLAQFLISEGMKTDIKNRSGDTAKEIARRNNMKEVLKVLQKSN